MEIDATGEQSEAASAALRRGLVEARLIGLYLYGSALAGGLRPDSDLDLLVVTDRRLRAEEKARVVEGLLPISGRETRPLAWRPLEVTIVAQPEVRPWRYPPRMELQYGEWLRDALEAGDVPEPAPNPDLAPLLAAARANGKPLLGPPAESILSPVPLADLRRAGVDSVPGLLADVDGDARNVLLTLARIAFTLGTGELAAKDAAAAWAASRVPAPHQAVLDLARELYLAGRDPEDWGEDLPAARAAAEHLATEIRRAAGGEHPDTRREG